MINNNQFLIDAHRNRSTIERILGIPVTNFHHTYTISTLRPITNNITQRVVLRPPLPASKENSQVLRRPNNPGAFLIAKLKLEKADGSFTRMPLYTDKSVYGESIRALRELPDIKEDEDTTTPKTIIVDTMNTVLKQLTATLGVVARDPSFTSGLKNYKRYHQKK
jgi:hypothetical protein